jgi:hypothetical protein
MSSTLTSSNLDKFTKTNVSEKNYLIVGVSVGVVVVILVSVVISILVFRNRVSFFKKNTKNRRNSMIDDTFNNEML